MLEPANLIAQRYHIVRRLTHSGSGGVYAARDTQRQVDVALKLIGAAPEVVRRIVPLAQALLLVRHPNLPVVSDYGTGDGFVFVVMDLVRGEDLGELLAWQTAALPVPRVLDWAAQLCAALDCLHRHDPPLLHADVAPRNLLLRDGDHLALLGLRLSPQPPAPSPYAAPETLLAQSERRSDVYAVAATLYHLLTRVPPPAAPQRQAAAAAGQADPLGAALAQNPQLPPELVALLQQALALRSEERPPTVAAFAERLAALRQRHAPPAAPIPADPRWATAPLPTLNPPDPTLASEYERRYFGGLLRQRIAEPLGALLAQLSAYEQSLGASPALRAAFGTLSGLVRGVAQHAHELGESFAATTIDELGLAAALEALSSQISRTYGVPIHAQLHGRGERLPRRLEVSAYRAAHLGLERAAALARAGQIWLSLQRDPLHLSVQIRDDGMFGSGAELLGGVRQQLAALGGSCVIQPVAPAGTQLQISLPLQDLVALTARERDVLKLLAEGLSNKQIAAALQLSPRTVNFHLDNIYAKLGVNSRTEAAVYALRYL